MPTMLRHASVGPVSSNDVQSRLIFKLGASLENVDKCESFILEKVIGIGTSSVVYLATCTRGRLISRRVAVKSSARSFMEQAAPSESAITAHISLHHPTLVSLHSTFIFSGSACLILELCEWGSLCDFLVTSGGSSPHSTSPLTEDQLRPIIRRTTEGLIALHSHGIVHGDLRPHNVFVTGDGRTKLGNFGRKYSASLANRPSHYSDLCNRAKYISPELIDTRLPDFPSDVWSLGCMIVVFLTGCSSFLDLYREPRSKNTEEALSELPAFLKISSLAEDLIRNLLKTDPACRLPLCDVLTHPFLDVSLPSRNLRDCFPMFADYKKESGLMENYSVEKAITFTLKEGHRIAAINKFTEKIQQHDKLQPVLSAGENALSTAINTESIPPPQLLPQLGSLISSSSITETRRELLTHQQPENKNRNVAYKRESSSLPTTHPLMLGDEQQKVARKAFEEVGNINYVLGCARRKGPKERQAAEEIRGAKDVQTRSPLLSAISSLPTAAFSSNLQPKGIVKGGSTALNVAPSSRPSECDDREVDIHYLQAKAIFTAKATNEECPPAILRTNAPTCLHVAPLLPQTHKVAQGQLVIMPSRKLIVDLREGERRAGGKGTSILIISPDGQLIQLHEAPHLSTPSVLSEPQATWALDELPKRYWASYKFASQFIGKLKKRTPWIVWDTPEAKFMVMSNGPKGDIHAIFPRPTHGLKEARYVTWREVDESSTRMKIKFSRQNGTLEISRFIPSTQKRGRGEWVSKSETVIQERLVLGDKLLQKLAIEERLGLGYMIEGLKLVETAETIYKVADRRGEREDLAAKLRPDLHFPDHCSKLDSATMGDNEIGHSSGSTVRAQDAIPSACQQGDQWHQFSSETPAKEGTRRRSADN